MNLMRKVFLNSIIVATFIISSCQKDEGKNYSDLEGTITNEFGQVLENAKIIIDANDSTFSNEFGKYLFKLITTGEHIISVSKELYLNKTVNTTILIDKVNILDIIIDAGLSHLDTKDTTLIVNAETGLLIMDIYSNCSWETKSTSSWIKCSVDKGYGNEQIKINWDANIGMNERTDTLQIISGNLIKNIIISQSDPIILLRSKGIIGNGMRDIKDSVLLLFNKPIIIESITSSWEYCIDDITYNYIQNNQGVEFTFTCAELGGNYPFIICVSDSEGNKIYKSIDVGFYNYRLEVEGYIVDFILSFDESFFWLVTRDPNRLLMISTEDMEILNSYDLDFTPLKIVINPYNNLLYALGGYSPTFIYDNKIHIINQQNGEIVKSIEIQPLEEDHPDYPRIYPISIGFTESGYGAIVLISHGMSGFSWRVIDSVKDDSLYKHDDSNYCNEYFNGIFTNYNNTKLIFTEPYGSCRLRILDGLDHTFYDLIPGSITRGVFITPNKMNNKIYFGQLYDQFIMDLDGSMSQISYLDNRADGSADFSYRIGDDNIIYFCDEDYFRLMDYNNVVTLMWCDVLYELQNFTSTINGKYTFAYKLDNPKSRLYRFKANDFFRHVE